MDATCSRATVGAFEPVIVRSRVRATCGYSATSSAGAPDDASTGVPDDRSKRKGGAMKALVYHGPGERSWDVVPDPVIQDPTDAIVRIDSATICGTDLHILKGDVPEVVPG